MPKKKKAKQDLPQTTAQQLGAVIKSARDIMRKDKGLNGDLDRLPMFTWIMFLKFLDDMERIREQEAELSGEKFRPAIEPPYRWRDWAAREDGITGDELIAFINQDEAVRPDGKRGPGLFAYLRDLQSTNGRDRRDVVANVFRGVVNRMTNGYLLRDVINKVNAIHFSSSEEIHVLGHFYESMLREMRDAAGDSGEFYTPRPVVQFMVKMIAPELGETVLDPACGTGGFLVASYEHLAAKCKTVEDRRLLQEMSILGQEAKALPYLLCEMNLLLHGLEYPNISYQNSLATPLKDIGHEDRVDIIVTNPPFGGEEEEGILGNFPSDLQTSETALLFLQLIMKMLKRPGRGSARGGRCAIVLPDGAMFATGIAERVRKLLVENYNLHTVVRLPKGVFAPYTPIPTNLLFFDCQGPTETIWYYQLLPPNDRKNYTKTKPLRPEEFEPVEKWWKSRGESTHSWQVAVDTIRGQNYNLDLSNPNMRSVEDLPPEQVIDEIVRKEEEINSLLRELIEELEGGVN